MPRERMTDLELPAYMRALAEARRQYAEESSERLTEQAEAVEFLDTMAKLLGISVDAEDWWDMTITGKRAKIFGRIQILRGLRPTPETSPVQAVCDRAAHLSDVPMPLKRRTTRCACGVSPLNHCNLCD